MATISQIREVIKKNGVQLKQKANVTGTGIGYIRRNGKLTDEVGLIVYVSEKLPLTALTADDLLPRQIENVRVDVVESVFKALTERTDKWRPAPGGVSIGHPLVTAGTLGCLLWRGDKRVILSNNHVLAAENKAQLGDAIVQPGRFDGGFPSSHTIATLLDFIPLRLARLNEVDAAVALPLPSDVSNEILEIGEIAGVGRVQLGDIVQKSGRTTRLTKGKVTAVDVVIRVSYGIGSFLFVNQLEISPVPPYTKMAEGGDSGSALLTLDKKLCGLIFGGSADGIALANRIEPILKKLRLTYSKKEPTPPKPKSFWQWLLEFMARIFRK